MAEHAELAELRRELENVKKQSKDIESIPVASRSSDLNVLLAAAYARATALEAGITKALKGSFKIENVSQFSEFSQRVNNCFTNVVVYSLGGGAASGEGSGAVGAGLSNVH